LEETPAKLRSDDPIKAVFVEITEIPVVPIGDDPRLQAAEAEARRRFQEFETVKTLVTVSGNSEHIWVDVDSISAGKIHGRLGNDPVDLGDLTHLQHHEIARTLISRICNF
jgi:uncharacterized protein YegJ (DUF2314 family)